MEINKNKIIENKNTNETVNNIFINSCSTCLKCGYSMNEIIKNYNTYYRINLKFIFPKFIFFVFEFIDDNNKLFKDNNEELDGIVNNMIKYNKEIINYFFNIIKINNNDYNLVGIISTPSL